jgi:molybdenum cofactor guanylyltransferase
MLMNNSTYSLPLYVLAGGHSSRFGSDKALADIEGRPLIAHVVEQFGLWTNAVTVVADHLGKYDFLGFRTIADRQPHLGPVGGLLAALNDCPSQWLLLAACDALVLDSAAIDRLVGEPRADCQAIAFKGERWEPLPALFEKSVLSVVNDDVERGSRSLWRLIEGVRHRAIPIAHGPVVCQINTREELLRVSGLSMHRPKSAVKTAGH